MGCDLTNDSGFLTEHQFQSTHPRGVRHHNAILDGYMSRFQSTHPRGVRHSVQKRAKKSSAISIHAPAWGATTTSGSAASASSYFNPRTRVGCDKIKKYVAVQGRISIHAPAWGATWLRRGLDPRRQHFNPRTRVGCDMQRDLNMRLREIFQSTHPRGVRLTPTSPALTTTFDFNPRTRVGCDPAATPAARATF